MEQKFVHMAFPVPLMTSISLNSNQTPITQVNIYQVLVALHYIILSTLAYYKFYDVACFNITQFYDQSWWQQLTTTVKKITMWKRTDMTNKHQWRIIPPVFHQISLLILWHSSTHVH